MPKIQEFMVEFIDEYEYEFSQNYYLITVSAGKILKSKKAMLEERKSWIRNSIKTSDAFGSLYLDVTSHLNGFFVISKADLEKVQK